MRYLFGLLCVCALGVMPLVGCSETTGGGGDGGSGGTAGDGGTGGMTGQEFPCTEQGINDAIAEGGGPHTFACEGPQTVTTVAEIVIDNNVALDGGGNLTVDGDDDHRVFFVNDGVTAEVTAFAVTRGRSTILSGPEREFNGGCIRNDGALTLTNSTVSLCSAPPPDNPMAEGGGGGIANGGTLTVRNSTISENTADFAGGGILNHGMLTMTNCTVSGNSPDAIRNWDTFTITNSTVSGNAGGGIHNRGSGTITKSTVSGNTGHGIYSQVDPPIGLTITDSTISGNTGDGFRNHSGTLMLTNNTVSGSISAGSGGDEVSSVMSTGTLIDGTCTTVVGGVGVAAWTSFGYNLESPGDTCGFDQTGDQVSVPDPMLGELANNGGPTMTHALGEGSVAIDAIPLDACFDTEGDQRGEPRPETGGDACDAGAFERQPDDQ